MSQLEEHEPRHWHDEKGLHRMPDLRRLPGYPKRFWDKDERGYVAHLEAHEAEREVPKRQHDDPPEIQTLFEVIETAEQTIAVTRRLIRAKRLELSGVEGV